MHMSIYFILHKQRKKNPLFHRFQPADLLILRLQLLPLDFEELVSVVSTLYLVKFALFF